MAENFKKHSGGPTPALEHGSQAWGNKVTGGSPKKHPHAQDPHQKKRPAGHRDSGNKDPFSPPNTPHGTSRSAGLMSPVSRYGQIRQHANPIPLIKSRSMNPEKVLPHGSQAWNRSAVGGQSGSQPSHTTVQGVRKQPGGMAKVRPNVPGQSAPGAVRTAKPQPSHMASAVAPRQHIAMTKKIRGMIGKAHHRQRSPY